jgi:hypothetical protein
MKTCPIRGVGETERDVMGKETEVEIGEQGVRKEGGGAWKGEEEAWKGGRSETGNGRRSRVAKGGITDERRGILINNIIGLN